MATSKEFSKLFTHYVAPLLWATATCVKCVAALPDSEYLALYDLYNATRGDSWGCVPQYLPFGVPWQFSTKVDPCEPVWMGVRCVELNETYHVALLSLLDCQMFGTVPDSISNLTQLQFLDLDTNNLVGSFPGGVTQLNSLQYLDLSSNDFHGIFPASIAKLTLLESLALNDNDFHGTVPPSIANCTSLRTLDLSGNFFSGTIPAELSALILLHSMFLEDNDFSGTIPESLGALTNLFDVYMGGSALTGTLPASLFMPQLVTLIVCYTTIAGRIPDFPPNSSISDLELNDNQLSGSIPVSFGHLQHLNYLDLGDNGLTGSIPALGSVSDFLTVFLGANMLTGELPHALYMSGVETFFVGDNHLSGTVPFTAQIFPAAQLLNLSYNHFHGTLAGANQMTNLYSLILQGNDFSGSLDNVFNASTQMYLLTVQLDNNQFTGTLPPEIFSLPSLQTLSIVGSCLRGTLPSNICNVTSLEALVLYGLTTGQSCRQYFLQQPSSTFGGSFPPCLLQLPLKTLLLSSNGLTGEMSNNWLVNETLLELDLSHNHISGSISHSIQNHSWLLLDLSHNKLGGTLQSDLFARTNTSFVQAKLRKNGLSPLIGLSPTLKLTTNRLSGRVPSTIMDAHDLSVLAGNLFACNYARSNLPQYDRDVHNYECASNSFDVSVYVWMAALFVFGVCALILNFSQAAKPVDDSFLVATAALLQTYRHVIKLSWYCAVVAMTVLMPYYATISIYEGTHTHQYAYVLSAIYTSGALAFAFDVVLWSVLLMGVYWVGCAVPGSYVTGAASYIRRTHESAVYYMSAALILVNVTTVLGVNIAFVYIVLYGSSNAQTAAQLALSVFKTAWNSTASPYLLRLLSTYFLSTEARQCESFFTQQLLIALFNNIAIPCLVVIFIDPNCFSNLLLPPQSDSVSYLYPSCDAIGALASACPAISYYVQELHYDPPFTYSFQCSASFVTSYAPAFIYMSLSSVLLDPLLQCALQQGYVRLTPGSQLHQTATSWMPRLLLDPSTVPVPPQGSRVVGATGLLVTLFTHLGILLTFGVVFPPVALAMAVSMSVIMYVTRYKLQCFLQCVQDAQLPQYVELISAECAKVGSREHVQRAVLSIICFCCAFYTLFLFDTLGDAQGFQAAVWVLIVVPLAPFAVMGGYVLVRFGGTKYLAGKAGKLSEEPYVVDIEMKEHVTMSEVVVNPIRGKL